MFTLSEIYTHKQRSTLFLLLHFESDYFVSASASAAFTFSFSQYWIAHAFRAFKAPLCFEPLKNRHFSPTSPFVTQRLRALCADDRNGFPLLNALRVGCVRMYRTFRLVFFFPAAVTTPDEI